MAQNDPNLQNLKGSKYPYSFKILKNKGQKRGANPENRPKSTKLGKCVPQNGSYVSHRREWVTKGVTKWVTRSRDLKTRG